jgi:hypothetical protein
MRCIVFGPWQIRIYAGTRVTLAAGFRALPQISQPDFFIVLRLIHDGFLPKLFQINVNQSTCLSKTLYTALCIASRAALHTAQENESREKVLKEDSAT